VGSAGTTQSTGTMQSSSAAVPAVDRPGQRGRKLDLTRDVVIRDAALEVLAEVGYDRLTIDGIAARAHSSKATIYRRWPGKAELIVDALSSRKGSPHFPDTGSLDGDLEAVAERFCGSDDRLDAQLMFGLITALAHDTDLREVFRRRFIDLRIAGLREVFERAADRGELSEHDDLDLVVEILPALVVHRLLVAGEAPDRVFIDRVLAEVILPLVARSVTPPDPAHPMQPDRTSTQERT
jgi:AcrR family transcriptional regulator